MSDQVKALILAEAALLDQRKFDQWLDLYTQDAEYWVPVLDGQESPHDELSIIFDTRIMMEARVYRLNHAMAHSQQPASRTCRIVGPVTVEIDGNTAVAHSTLMMAEFRADRQFVFAGHVTHHCINHGSRWQIQKKRVDLVNSEGPHEMISLPF